MSNLILVAPMGGWANPLEMEEIHQQYMRNFDITPYVEEAAIARA